MARRIKKEIIEWSILILVLGGLYITGWHTEVLGTLQRGVLATGIIRPDLDEPTTQKLNYNFQLTNLEQEHIPMDTYKDEVLFINLWATWCPPCIAEMPDIHNLYEKKGQKVKFLMISLDDDPSKAAKFIARKDFDFPVFTAAQGLPKELHTRSIPTTYVVDKKGNIRVVRRGLAKYNTSEFISFLDELLSE